MTSPLVVPQAVGSPPDHDLTPINETRRRMPTWASSLLLLVVWFVLLGPTLLGGPASYVIVAGDSMEPSMRSGDLVVARERSSYGIGDVVVYRVPGNSAGAGSSVIHRIVGGTSDGYVTQGDNRAEPDLWRPTDEDILGASLIRIPAVGRIVGRLRTPLPLAVIAAGLTIWLVGFDDKKRKARRSKDADAAQEPLEG